MHQRKRTKKRATKRATKRSTKGPTKHPSSKQFTKKNMKSFSQITHKLPTEKIYTYPDPVLDFFDQFNYDEFILQHNNVNILINSFDILTVPPKIPFLFIFLNIKYF